PHQLTLTDSSALSLHDALPILSGCCSPLCNVLGVGLLDVLLSLLANLFRFLLVGREGERLEQGDAVRDRLCLCCRTVCVVLSERSEEHTSELQSRENLVCRLLL